MTKVTFFPRKCDERLSGAIPGWDKRAWKDQNGLWRMSEQITVKIS